MKFMNVILFIVACVAMDTFAKGTITRTQKSPTPSVTAPALQTQPSVQSLTTPTKLMQSSNLLSDDKVVGAELKKVQKATNEAAKIKKEAEAIIKQTRDQLSQRTINRIQAAQTIGQQKYRIAQSEKKLAEVVEQSVAEVEIDEAEQSYFQQLVSGAQNVGAYIAAPFKSGYGYSEKEKDIARATIAELQEQRESMTSAHQEKMKKKLSPATKRKLQSQYAQNMKKITDEIYQQQLITGEVMSTTRKLFWGAVGVAGAVIGGAAVKRAMEEAPVVSEEVPAPPVTPSVSPAQPVTPSVSPVVTPEAPKALTEAPKSWKEKLTKKAAELEEKYGQTIKKGIENIPQRVAEGAEAVIEKVEEIPFVQKQRAARAAAEAAREEAKIVAETQRRFEKEQREIAAELAEQTATIKDLEKSEAKAEAEALKKEAAEAEALKKEAEERRQAREKEIEALAQAYPEEKGLMTRTIEFVRGLFGTKEESEEERTTRETREVQKAAAEEESRYQARKKMSEALEEAEVKRIREEVEEEARRAASSKKVR